MSPFSNIKTWIFDLDNTLYPADSGLFQQIDQRMTQFVQNKLKLPAQPARKVQKELYVQYGTTLSGMMHEYGTHPDEFMEFVHDIDVSAINPDLNLAHQLRALPGHKIIFTNGSVAHAQNVTRALGIENEFEGIFDIKATDYLPKPGRPAYERFVGHFGLSPQNCAMFEDMAVNLEVPFAMGMKTILICAKGDWIIDEPVAKRPARLEDVHAHVHYQTDNLTHFLGQLNDMDNQQVG